MRQLGVTVGQVAAARALLLGAAHEMGRARMRSHAELACATICKLETLRDRWGQRDPVAMAIARQSLARAIALGPQRGYGPRATLRMAVFEFLPTSSAGGRQDAPGDCS